MKKNAVKSSTAYDLLLAEIQSGRYRQGDAILPLRDLCSQLNLSNFAVRQALARLEEDGFIERRHGSGNYIRDLRPAASMTDAVALCMDLRGHLFGELSRELIRRLQMRRRPVLPVDMLLASCDDMFLSTIRANPGLVVMQGDISVRSELLDQVPAELPIVLLFNQMIRTSRPIDWRVEIDHQHGGEIAAQTLWREGHRRVVVVGPESMLRDFPAGSQQASLRRQGPSFIEHWRALGGDVHVMSGKPERDRRGHVGFEIDAFGKAIGRGKNQATAVFATRDVDAFDIQSMLAQSNASLLKQLTWFGYGDTPWRLFSPARLHSINLRLDMVAQCVEQLATKPRHELDGGADVVLPMIAVESDASVCAGDMLYSCDQHLLIHEEIKSK